MTVESHTPVRDTHRTPADTTTVIEPRELSIRTTWPSGGTHHIELASDMDLPVHCTTGLTDSEDRPIRYAAEGGMVLVNLGVDGGFDEIRVATTLKGGDMIEVLQETVEACQRSLDALRKIKACRV